MSIYPNAIDGYEQLPLIVDGITPVNAFSVNTLREAILKIEIELGITPSGIFSTVAERFDSLDPNNSTALIELENRVTQLEIDVTNLINQPSLTLSLIAGENLVEGSICRINLSGEIVKANAGTGNVNDSRVVGVSTATVLSGNSAEFNSFYGSLFPILFSAVPLASSNGSPVYLSNAVSGEATLIAPDSSGSVVFIIGILQGADGITNIPNVLFQPRFIADLR